MNFVLSYLTLLEMTMYLHSGSSVNDLSLKFNWFRAVRKWKGETECAKRKNRVLHGNTPYFFLRDYDSRGLIFLEFERKKKYEERFWMVRGCAIFFSSDLKIFTTCSTFVQWIFIIVNKCRTVVGNHCRHFLSSVYIPLSIIEISRLKRSTGPFVVLIIRLRRECTFQDIFFHQFMRNIIFPFSFSKEALSRFFQIMSTRLFPCNLFVKVSSFIKFLICGPADITLFIFVFKRANPGLVLFLGRTMFIVSLNFSYKWCNIM